MARSLRARLTTQYAGVIFGTAVVVYASVFASFRAATYADLINRSSVRAEAAWNLFRWAVISGGLSIQSDSITGQQQIGILPSTRGMLDVLAGPYLMLNKKGLVYASPSVKPLWDSQDSALTVPLDSLVGTRQVMETQIAGKNMLLVKRDISDPAFGELRVVVGADLRPVDNAPLEIIGPALIILPIILGFSIAGGWFISGHATASLKSVDRITMEVTAITDGRSLHRRLAPDTTSAELARLTTQLNSMIGRLETSFAGLRRFTADASHELKTPLTVLRADVERAMHAPPQSTEQFVALEEALQETTRMSELVESLLTLARADEGRFDIVREPIHLEPLVHEVMETALILGEHAGIDVKLPLIQDSVVLGDRTRLRQLFLNLVINALKYTARGGEVELTLVRTDGEAVFSVRDTGIGISAADLPHVFERFWRADRARSRVGERGGFGLGLAIGQWIAQAHGGTLTVQSRLHRGSTFTVTLPLAPPTSERESLPSSDAEELRVAS